MQSLQQIMTEMSVTGIVERKTSLAIVKKKLLEKMPQSFLLKL